MEIRSFLAFELPSDIRKEVFRISGEVKKSGLEAGWVKPGNIHLTVVFLGDINEKDIPAIIYSIDNVTCRYEAFDISLGGVGLFPDIRRPRVLWLGLDGETERLASLRDDLQKPLEAFGVKQEKRPFSPHLTLGRFRRPVKEKSLLKRYLMSMEIFPVPVDYWMN
jgi:2'-5' RNA ligase